MGTYSRGVHRAGLVGWAVGLLLLSLMSCATVPGEPDFLTEGLNRYTQEEIRNRLGDPQAIQKLDNGGSMWTYRYRRTGISGTAVVGQTHCWEYHLRFDRQKIFRGWEGVKCKTNLSTSRSEDALRG
ncbi:MAG: hypothetical protein ACE5NA_03985 [Nitrospiraceae bacterium]